jgi:hypothetical protein
MGAGMEGADVSGLEKAGQRCLQGAELAAAVRQVMEGIVAALSAMSFFAGPWVAPIIAFLTTTIIPWLRNVEDALRSFGGVLAGRAAAQRRLSEGLPVNLAELPRYTPIGGPSPLPGGGSGGAGPANPGGPGPSPRPGGGSGPRPGGGLPGTGGLSRGGADAAGGGGDWGGSSAAPVPLGSLDDQGPAGPGIAAPGVPAGERPAPVPVRPNGRGVPTAGLAMGLAAAGLVGGAATYAAARRRRDDTDGSELLGSTTVDRGGEHHPDTITAADLAGPRPETPRPETPRPETPAPRPPAPEPRSRSRLEAATAPAPRKGAPP